MPTRLNPARDKPDQNNELARAAVITGCNLKAHMPMPKKSSPRTVRGDQLFIFFPFL